MTIVGGKWTTYRKMAEDAMSHAIVVGGLPSKVCVTETLRVHGALDRDDPTLPAEDPLRTYGADAAAIVALASEGAGWGDPLHPHLPYTLADIVWSCRHEMAMSVEDCARPPHAMPAARRPGVGRGRPAGRRDHGAGA